MKKHVNALPIGAALGLMILILDNQTAFRGAKDGIDLCIKTIIPSLFPFFLLSALLTSYLAGREFLILRPLGRLCHMPPGAESFLAVGLLGGYPVGAQNIGTAYRTGALPRGTAERLLPFCSNAGPAFLFGIIAPQFGSVRIPWLLWGIHIVSALIVGMLLPGKESSVRCAATEKPMSVSQALENSVKVMARVCGWVILFRVLISFLDRWFLWLFPTAVQISVAGSLELSNGCVQLFRIKNEGLRMILASGMLAFGGFCVGLQTLSVTEGLSLRFYFPGKLFQCAVSIALTALAQFFFPQPMRCPHYQAVALGCVLAVIFLDHFLRRQEKTVAFHRGLLYNPNITPKEGNKNAVSKKNRTKLQLLRPQHKAG